MLQWFGVLSRPSREGSSFVQVIEDPLQPGLSLLRRGHEVETAERPLCLDQVGQKLVARVGGEEFLIILPKTDLNQARIAAGRLCREIEETKIEITPAMGIVGQTTITPPLIPNCVKADSLWDSQSAKSLNLWVQIWEDVAWV